MNKAAQAILPNRKAVIYCRVSGAKQVREGDGLGSQETRCREYAKYKSYQIVEVFQDQGVSGGMIDRPGMKDMLDYLGKHKQESVVVIIDDISRLARGLEAHLQLRTAIGDVGGKLESPSIEFGEDSDSILVENLLASVSQHQRQKNTEQTKNRMRSRMMNGYWVFATPVGYKYKKVRGGGNVLVPDEPHATTIREALQRFADGRFETQIEVKRYLESHPSFPLVKKGTVNKQRIRELLERILYAGYIDVPDWGINMQPGKHEALISYETYQRIQERLNTQAKVPARKAICNDFPLRGFVTCGKCNHVMTAAWSQGKAKKYPYYFCQNKNCSERKKSIRKEKIEKDFEHLLARLSPDPRVFLAVEEMLREVWDERLNNVQGNSKELKTELSRIENKIDQLMERVIEADSAALVKAYEAQIKKLQTQQIILQENMAKADAPIRDFDETYRTSLLFLSNPRKLWDSGVLDNQRLVLKLAFEERLPYWRNGGYRTPKTTLPFKVLEGVNDNKFGVVRSRGLEPPRACAHSDLNA
ncbi:MAG: recombinase family protein, partial [Methyloligellaceae bacterium]